MEFSRVDNNKISDAVITAISNAVKRSIDLGERSALAAMIEKNENTYYVSLFGDQNQMFSINNVVLREMSDLKGELLTLGIVNHNIEEKKRICALFFQSIFNGEICLKSIDDRVLDFCKMITDTFGYTDKNIVDKCHKLLDKSRELYWNNIVDYFLKYLDDGQSKMLKEITKQTKQTKLPFRKPKVRCFENNCKCAMFESDSTECNSCHHDLELHVTMNEQMTDNINVIFCRIGDESSTPNWDCRLKKETNLDYNALQTKGILKYISSY